MKDYSIATKIIMQYEGFRANPYYCPAGVKTIGFGRTSGDLNTPTTPDKEEAWLIERIKSDERDVSGIQANFNSLNDNQKAAILSLVYNIGLGQYSQSSVRRLTSTTPNDFLSISNAFSLWNKGGGVILLGLVNRRLAESRLYSKPITTENKEVKIMPNLKSNLSRAAFYTDNLNHQLDAWDWLNNQIPDLVIDQFLAKFRSKTEEVKKETKPSFVKVNLLSQRVNQGDWNGDGRPEWLQTCQVTSIAMVANALCNRNLTPYDVDSLVKGIGDRYTHSVLVKAMSTLGLKSTFDVDHTVEDIKKCLNSGGLVIWSNKLTASGHVVVVAGYTDQGFYIYDPYGEPMISGSGVNYKDVRKPYYLSYKSFDKYGMNGNGSHWAHLVYKA